MGEVVYLCPCEWGCLVRRGVSGVLAIVLGQVSGSAVSGEFDKSVVGAEVDRDVGRRVMSD